MMLGRNEDIQPAGIALGVGHVVNPFGDSRLAECSATGDEARVSDLIGSCVRQDLEHENIFGFTPLIRAVMAGSESIVRILLERGADPAHADKDGRTPLIWAVKRQHAAVLRVLLTHGAPTEARTRYGATAMHEAAMRGCHEAITLLQRHGAKIDTPNAQDWTPLMLALPRKRLSAAWCLLELGASVHAMDAAGISVLILAVRTGDAHLVAELLRRGADPTVYSLHGPSPLLEASLRRHSIIQALIRDAIFRKRMMGVDSVRFL